MQDFTIGQRWVSAGEVHLGVGMVLEVEFRNVSIIFPATGETRIYAKQSAPLSRVAFSPGDHIEDQQGRQLEVLEVLEKGGLLTYLCEDQQGHPVRLSEGKLNNFLKLNQPLQRLLNGQIDKNRLFELRARTQKIHSMVQQSPLYGLTGCRTSLIDHQLYIAHEVARRHAPRVLLADEVGLGKTIEAGLIMHQQLLTERVSRVLVVVPESLLHQWLVEMMRRFNLLFSVFDEERCDAIDGKHHEENSPDDLVSLENPFHSEQLVLCSLEFLLKNPQRFNQSLDGDWDMLVVDEAHHLVWSAQSPSTEYQLVEQLAQRIPAVMLLTATPEQLGKESHFARLRLLDPDRFSDLEHFLHDESHYQPIADIVEALLLGQALDQAQQQLLQQTTAEGDNQFQIEHLQDDDENVALRSREELVEHLLDRHGTGRLLFRNTRHTVSGFPDRQLQSYALECPEVYLGLYDELTDNDEVNPQWLLSPEIVLQALTEDEHRWGQIDPRIDWLADFLPHYKHSKVLIICSSAQTVLSLVQQIKQRTGINLAAFHEGLTLVERDRAAAWFADREAGTQAMVCSEIGSEGRNFQFAHHLVLFDLPYNPDLLEQRIGRLDRIGQQNTVSLHVPYLRNSPQQVMMNWLHRGLNAFEHTCAAGHNVFMQLRDELNHHLRHADEDHEAFYQRSTELYQQLNQQLLQGRDRLLEYNSCRPHVASGLRDQAETLYHDLDLARYMEQLYDTYGVSFELKSAGCWVLKPTEHMIGRIPGLPDDGMTVTYDREIALTQEDVRYLSWEHPLVSTMMDMVQSSELGNTALIAIKYRNVPRGTLLLDCFFRIEISDKRMEKQDGHRSALASRYLPDNLLRICIDERGQQHQQHLSPATIQAIQQMVDLDTSVKVVKSREEVIKKLLDIAEKEALAMKPPRIDQAIEQATDSLQKEVDRLKALSTINPNVRRDEIDFFQQQLEQTLNQINQANLRLDAVRVLVAV